MAYTCADSGNLMAIAQQVMLQQQQQEQNSTTASVASFSDSFTGEHPLWAEHGGSELTPVRDEFPCVFPEPSFTDPFETAFVSGGVLFDSCDWMEKFIGESPAESLEPMGGVWQGNGVGENVPCLFADASASDLNLVVFPLGSMPSFNPIPACSQSMSLNPPLKQAGSPMVDPVVAQNDAESTFSSNLLKSLISCARIIDSSPEIAAKSIMQIRDIASDDGDLTERIAFYFAEALSSRLGNWKIPAPDFSSEEIMLAGKTFNEACPFYKFAHLTANQAILEATESAGRIHIIDFGIVHGVQWAALLQALATRSAGKPSRIRISGIPAFSLAASAPASLAATGKHLLDFAKLLDMDLEFEPVLTPINDLNPASFRVEPGESIAVNFMLHLHTLLGDSDDAVERAVRLAAALRPNIITLGEHDVRLNRAGFAERFGNALGYYAAVFESLEAATGRVSGERTRVERAILGPRILGAVGLQRTERMECKDRWMALMERCGLKLIPLSHYAVSQAKLLLWNYEYSPKYSLLDSPPGLLSLTWHNQALLMVSSWR